MTINEFSALAKIVAASFQTVVKAPQVYASPRLASLASANRCHPSDR